MPNSTFNKTIGTALLPHTVQNSGAITVGQWIEVTSMMRARIVVDMGRTGTTALTNEVLFQLEGTRSASGYDGAFPLYTWTSSLGKTAANAPTLNGATSAGASTFVVSSATGILQGKGLYLRETGTPANSEWCKVKSMSSTTVSPFDNLTRAHTSGITVTDLAERMSFTQNLDTIARIRLIVNSASDMNGTAAASGQTVDVIAWLNTLDAVAS